MLKKILSFVLALAIFAVVPVVSGCNEDKVEVKRTTKVENVPAGSHTVITGDNP